MSSGTSPQKALNWHKRLFSAGLVWFPSLGYHPWTFDIRSPVVQWSSDLSSDWPDATAGRRSPIRSAVRSVIFHPP
ncbi:hypothetical protein D3C83_171610 [compost metagenome]